MLANQGLCLGHVHRGRDFAQPEGHNSRPHLHFGGHDLHAHDEATGHISDSGIPKRALAAAIVFVSEHDSDAVYFSDMLNGTREATLATVVLAKYVATAAVGHLADHSDRLLRLGSVRGQPASVFDAACPIYLRTLSLRI